MPLEKEIEAITAKFAFRRACYIGSKQGWTPAAIAELAADYDDLVQAEPEDSSDDSERE